MPIQSHTEQASAPIIQDASGQLHRFADGEETIVVRTILQPNGTYTAFDINDDNPNFPVGFGFSTIGAIADLFEKMPRAASEREERDSQAAAFDRARALRNEAL